MNGDPQRLIGALGCRMLQPRILERALTHRSAGASNNERLEFLGDALLGLVVAEALVHRFPDANEGSLSRLRATLVKEESLARLARGLDLGDYLRLGVGERRSGGFARDSILADALEAVLGAIYLDQGLEAAREVILSLFRDPLATLGTGEPAKDPKTRLQELLQARRRSLPRYEVTAVAGDQHAQRFRVRCSLPDGLEASEGEGSSRRRAEQQAAEQMLGRLPAAQD